MVIEKLTEIIRRYIGNVNLVLKDEDNLLNDVGLNSLDVVNLVCDVEEAFGIEIPDRDIKTLKTVGEVREYIEKKRQAG